MGRVDPEGGERGGREHGGTTDGDGQRLAGRTSIGKDIYGGYGQTIYN